MLGTKQVLLEKQPVFLTADQSIQPPAPGFLMKLDYNIVETLSSELKCTVSLPTVALARLEL